MRISSINNLSAFKAKLIHNQYSEDKSFAEWNETRPNKYDGFYSFDAAYGFKTRNEAVQDTVNFYDERIRFLQKQKNASLELDKFMHKKHISKLLDKLPENAGINMCTYKDGRHDQLHINGRHPNLLTLEYYPESYSDKAKIAEYDSMEEDQGRQSNSFRFYCQKKNQKIDKQGIQDWLSRLARIINK